jgi:S-(hydroxymethyl)mycothiol dehydrogenase
MTAPSTQSAKAALLTAPREISVETIEFGPPGPGEVQIGLHAAGVCHTDLHIANSEGGWGRYPLLLGHEGAGVVEAIGAGVAGIAEGDPVAIACRVPCGRCRMCIRGNPRRCKASSPRPPALRRASDGAIVTPALGVGLFSTRVLVDRGAVVPLDHDMPLDKAALLGCAVLTGVGAVVNSAAVWPGARVAVVGCGGIGLSVVQGAKLANAAQIIAVDVIPRKLAWAEELGAAHVVDASRDDPVQTVRQLTGGDGVDFSFEAVGLAGCVDQCLRMLAYGGVATIIGVPGPEEELTVDLGDTERGFFRNTNTLTVSHGGDSIPAHDVPVLAALYKEGKLDLDRMATHQVSIDDVEQGFRNMEKGAAIRTVVRFDP